MHDLRGVYGNALTAHPAGILYGELDNSAGVAPADFTGVIVARLAAVRKADLSWNSGVDANGKTAAFTAVNGRRR